MIKIYQVGGSVRDELMGKPSSDLDYVVVGATPEDLIKKGFTQVGADFPVFLHPQTKDEYALARTERKTGNGYHGFETSFDSDVTLEDDLKRRDLTINAMAKDSSGNIIDPFGGKADIENKTLRHVNDSSFPEDPLRILRVARFAARFDFSVHPETMNLMQSIHNSGETSFLTKERIWKEYYRVLKHEHVSSFYKCLEEVGIGKDLFPSFYIYENPEFYLNDKYDIFLKNKNIEQKIAFNILPPSDNLPVKENVEDNLRNISAPKDIIDAVLLVKKIWNEIQKAKNNINQEFYFSLMMQNDALRRPSRFITAYECIFEHIDNIGSCISLKSVAKMEHLMNSLNIDAQTIAKEGNKKTIPERVLNARKESFDMAYRKSDFKLT